MEKYKWIRARWTADKLIAASPFRYDNKPSFFVWLRDNPATGAKAGDWVDSGAIDPYWAKGSFLKLLAFLRHETEEETAMYLREKYSFEYNTDEISLELPDLHIKGGLRFLDERILNEYRWRHPYLTQRGISEEVQRMMRVGFDREHRAVVIPWFTADGRLANVKFRCIGTKKFWFAKGGWPIRELVYGIDVIYRKNIRRAALVEAEIDAMYLMSAGVPALAIGGCVFNEYKRDVIVRSPIEEVVIMSDHDDAGQAWKRKATEMLVPYVRVRIAGYPMRFKDPNEVADLKRVRAYVERSKLINHTGKFLIMTA